MGKEQALCQEEKGTFDKHILKMVNLRIMSIEGHFVKVHKNP